MIKTKYSSFFIYTLIGSALIFANGCSQKKITPPASTQEDYVIPEIPPAEDRQGNSQGMDSDQYQPFSEEDLLTVTEGSLDDTSQDDPLGMEINASELSLEYLIMHGRSSKEMEPVYFNFDQTNISPAMQEIIFNNSRVLKNNPSLSVVIQGNTDQSGTNEYNMALGERRALNVSKYLISLGVDTSRVRTISLGEEQPLFTDGSEDSHRHNRRADFVVE